MSPRRLGPTSIVRLLGAWRSARGAPAYRQLADGLRLLILDGRLPLDVVLPGERDLAQVLEVSRTTVTAALSSLRDGGFLDRRQGAGARTRLPHGPGERAAVPFTDGEGEGVLDLAAAAPPASELIHGAYAAALSLLPAHLSNHGYAALGLAMLRQVIAERYSRRGLLTAPEQIMVTNGAQHGLALLLRLLCGPGDRVVIDHPTYPHAIDAIQRASCRAVPVGLPAADGWDVEGIAAALRQSGPRMAYLIPEFHNPTGRWMDGPSRAALADAASRVRTALIFDETLVDLWLDAPIRPYDFDEPDAGLIRLGSMGKSFWGGLRLGWIRADVQTIQGLALRRASIDLGTPLLEQLAAAHLLADDETGLACRRVLLRQRRDHLMGLMAARLPDWIVRAPAGGLSLWAELPAPVSTALAATCERFGVRLAAGPRFGVDGAFERFVRVPYTLEPDQLGEAVDRLALAYARLQPGAMALRSPVGAVV